MTQGENAINGAFERAKQRPDLNLSARECREKISFQGWDDQWLNWDDWGKDEPSPGGWGDAR